MTFSNITKEPPDDWIGEGIAETVTADLKKIEGLAVVGRCERGSGVEVLFEGTPYRLGGWEHFAGST